MDGRSEYYWKGATILTLGQPPLTKLWDWRSIWTHKDGCWCQPFCCGYKHTRRLWPRMADQALLHLMILWFRRMLKEDWTSEADHIPGHRITFLEECQTGSLDFDIEPYMQGRPYQPTSPLRVDQDLPQIWPPAFTPRQDWTLPLSSLDYYLQQFGFHNGITNRIRMIVTNLRTWG